MHQVEAVDLAVGKYFTTRASPNLLNSASNAGFALPAWLLAESTSTVVGFPDSGSPLSATTCVRAAGARCLCRRLPACSARVRRPAATVRNPTQPGQTRSPTGIACCSRCLLPAGTAAQVRHLSDIPPMAGQSGAQRIRGRTPLATMGGPELSPRRLIRGGRGAATERQEYVHQRRASTVCE
jgi:hypothetical protein